jgi:hypothetical protein
MENKQLGVPTEEFSRNFMVNSDETGRHKFYSRRTGKTFYIEPIGDGRGGDWGSENPATKTIEHKKGDGKFTGSVKMTESMITPENGFLPENIHFVENGSPYSVIEELDAKNPTINDVSFKGSNHFVENQRKENDI